MANFCSQTLSGITSTCDPSKGGIVKVWIVDYSDVTAIGYDSTAETQVTGITLASGVSWNAYSFKKGTGSMTSTLNVDVANGVNYVSTELVLQFSRMDTEKRIEMAALSLKELAVVVKDANGSYWLLGANEPVTASAGNGQTGTARTDGNFYTITLSDESDTWPAEVLNFSEA